MILKKYINDTLNKNSTLQKNDLFKIIIFLDKSINNIESIYLNINKEINFNINKSNKIINKFLYKNYPLEYIIRKCFFYNYTYYIRKGVFIPRPETEYIVDKIIKKNKNKNNLQVLDLCSGSGCISNTIKMECSNFYVIGIEKKIIPFFISKINSKKYNLDTKYLKKNIFSWIKKNKKKFDIVVCNPPYISKEYKLPNNVKKEPKCALFAKNNGLHFYDIIIKNINNLINKNGVLIFEIGENQKYDIKNILKKYNLNNYDFEKDQYKKDRMVFIRRNKNENFKNI